MENVLALMSKKERINTIIFDFVCLAVMFFLPAMSHLSALPIYLIEPLRIMIILGLVHTRKENAIVMAALLPIFSYLVSGHPFFAKMLVISIEMVLNVGIYFFLVKLLNKPFFPMLLAIVFSKMFYFGCEYLFLGELIKMHSIGSHPLYIQGILTVLLSIYASILIKRKGQAQPN